MSRKSKGNYSIIITKPFLHICMNKIEIFETEIIVLVELFFVKLRMCFMGSNITIEQLNNLVKCETKILDK